MSAELETFCGVIATALSRGGDSPAFHQPNGRNYSYGQTAEKIGAMSAVLKESGIGRGQGIAILSTNCAEAWMASHAVQYARGYYVSLPWRSSVEDQAFIATDSEVDAIVCHPDLRPRAEEIAALCPNIRNIFSLGFSEGAADLLAAAERRLASGAGVSIAEAEPDDICVLWYTGGTTGRPKGAIHTQSTVLAAVRRSVMSFELPDQIRYLAAAPLSHGGWTFLPPTLIKGGVILVMDKFEADGFIDLVNDYAITLAVGVPTMVYAVVDAAEARGIDMPSLKRFIYGGAPISPQQLARAQSRIGNIFTQFYGQSEILGSACVLRSEHHDVARPDRLASCGRAVEAVQVALLDDQDQPVASGDIGELCFRTDSAMLGYWKQPQLTADTLRAGWVHSGDLARQDMEGFYTLVDRKKEMIVSGGYNVFPAEVEAVLAEFAGVAQAAVIGVPDHKWGEAVKAVIVVADGAILDPEELKEYVRQRKGAVNAPKTVDIVENLPLTPAGKVDKKALRTRYWMAEERQIAG